MMMDRTVAEAVEAKYREAAEKAIGALLIEMTEQASGTDELISKQKAIDAIEGCRCLFGPRADGNAVLDMAKRAVKNQPGEKGNGQGI
jgi:hypothetical protein